MPHWQCLHTPPPTSPNAAPTMLLLHLPACKLQCDDKTLIRNEIQWCCDTLDVAARLGLALKKADNAALGLGAVPAAQRAALAGKLIDLAQRYTSFTHTCGV